MKGQSDSTSPGITLYINYPNQFNWNMLRITATKQIMFVDLNMELL